MKERKIVGSRYLISRRGLEASPESLQLGVQVAMARLTKKVEEEGLTLNQDSVIIQIVAEGEAE